MATAATTLPTPRIDLSELFRDAWRLARAGAVASACSVRLCLGNGLRMAWARARYALARRAAAAALRERIAINDKLMHDVQAEIDAGWGIFARSPEELYEHMDRLHHHGIQMRDELAELEGAPVPQQAQQQQASGGAPEPVEPAPAPEPDLSTVEGLRSVLVGRTANLTLQGGEALYTVVSVERWTRPDGAMVHDYIKLETTGFLADDRKGPTGLYIARKGTGRGSYIETVAGDAYWGYGRFCDSGNKRSNANDVVKGLLAPIAL